MEFLRVARCGQTTSGGGWKISYLHTHRTAARIGINLNKRLVRHATHRNRLRRVLRERFRQHWRAALPSVDILLQPTVAPADEQRAVQICANLLADIPQQPPQNLTRTISNSDNAHNSAAKTAAMS